MGCARCAEQSSAGRSYCGGCGTPLRPLCAGCGATLPPSDPYCSACGARQPDRGLAEGTATADAVAAPESSAPPDDELLPSYPPRLFAWLLLGLVARFAVYPFLSTIVDARLVLDSALIVVIVWVALLIERDRHLVQALGVLGVLTIAVNGLTYFVWLDPLAIMQRVLMLGFYGAATLMILRCVLRRERVTLDKIYGAVCAYLLVAFTWGFAYDLLEILQPGSFQIPEVAAAAGGRISARRVELAELIYFSFMTMTSVGYTDITVNSDNARTFVLVQAVVGQIYPVVLISRLVNLQVTSNALPGAPSPTQAASKSLGGRRAASAATHDRKPSQPDEPGPTAS